MSADAPGISQALCDALRRYLERHPDAADSPEGIRRWWLPQGLQAIPLGVLLPALEHLVDGGEMQRTTLPDGTALYARGNASVDPESVHDQGH